MADEAKYGYHETPKPTEEPCAAAVEVESTDRGLFGFGKKKEEEKCEETAIATDFEKKVQVCEPEVKEEPKEEEKHESLIEKLRRSDSSSSSSSEEEVEGENGEKIKRKKKKGLKEKITGKISGDKEEEKKYEDTSVPVEKCDDVVAVPEHEEEKKGFLDKIKDKLPGGKKTEEVAAPPPPPAPVAAEYPHTTPEADGKEKKGFLDKIKEKLPGYHPKTDEEKEKEKEKEGAC